LVNSKKPVDPLVLAVAVLVMNVREVLVAVAQRFVLMLVGMWLDAIPSLRVLMLMMRIVHVSVGMPKLLMSVHVHVLLRNVQVHADYHQ
jgi:hypothetical protein